MDSSVTRRGFVRAVGVGAGAVAGVAAMQAYGAESVQGRLKIMAVSCSAAPRQDDGSGACPLPGSGEGRQAGPDRDGTH